MIIGFQIGGTSQCKRTQDLATLCMHLKSMHKLVTIPTIREIFAKKKYFALIYVRELVVSYRIFDR